MYESPITKIYGDIQEQILKQDEENLIYSVNQAVGYQVDKDELVKALQYDRNQYTKGYEDGKKEVLDKLAAEIFNACSDSYHMPIYKLSCDEISEIIDKYKTGSEG